MHLCFTQSWYVSSTPWLGRGQSVTTSCPRATSHQQTRMVYSIVNHRNPPPSCSNPVSSLGAAHQLSTGCHLVLVQVRHLQMCWVATSSYITNLYSRRAVNFYHSSSPEVSAPSRPTAFISAGTRHLLPHTSLYLYDCAQLLPDTFRYLHSCKGYFTAEDNHENPFLPCCCSLLSLPGCPR